MVKVKFIKTSEMIEVGFRIVNKNIVELQGKIPRNENGFNVYSRNNVLLGEYQEYKTIYKVTDNGIQFSNDGSIYVKPVPIPPPEPVPPYVPTEEELAEMARQNRIFEINNQIYLLKEKLQSTDYIFIKCYEASLVGKKVEEYDLEALHIERQSIREKINALEEELETYNT